VPFPPVWAGPTTSSAEDVPEESARRTPAVHHWTAVHDELRDGKREQMVAERAAVLDRSAERSVPDCRQALMALGHSASRDRAMGN
jgi:hypothetical protein